MFLYGELSVVISAMSVWMDLKDASVDNGWILFSFMIGFLIQITENGPKGGVIFLAGVAVPVLLLGILFIFHMIGAGDIKLLCVTGGFLGPADGFRVLIASLLIGGVISVWIMIRQKNFTGRMMYFMEYAQRRAAGGSWESYMADVPESAKFCFSVPVFLSVLGYIGGIF